MKRVPFVLSTVGACVLVAATVRAQEIIAPPGANDAPVTSLKVLPRDQFKTFGQILPTMQAIRDALGVGCVYCHTYTAAYNPANDFVSDAKPTKDKARAMMRMVQDINQHVRTEIPPLDRPATTNRQPVTVTCVTCHRGVPIPRQLVDIVTDTGNARGAAAAVAQYRDLRTRYFGNQSYDFTDATLYFAGMRANAANKPDDAIAYAQLNLEFNPRSARSHWLMSKGYQLKKDRAAAIAAMEKAAATAPETAAFKNELEELKKE